jgi:hypothetical protein
VDHHEHIHRLLHHQIDDTIANAQWTQNLFDRGRWAYQWQRVLAEFFQTVKRRREQFGVFTSPEEDLNIKRLDG